MTQQNNNPNPESMTNKIVAYLADESIDVKAVLLGLACDVEALREEVTELKAIMAQYKAAI